MSLAGIKLGGNAPFFQKEDARKDGQLYDALIEHRIGDFDESGNVRANNKIARMPVFGGGFPRVFVDR